MEEVMEEVPAGYVNRHPGEILARAFSGESILVTSYGRPYAIICPPPQATPAAEDGQTSSG